MQIGNPGAGKPGEAGRAGWLGAAMAMTLLTTFGLCFASVPRLLVGAFSSDPAIVAVGSRALLVTACAQPFMAFATVMGMGLRGAGDTRTVLVITVVAGVGVRLAATYFFAVTLGFGLAGIWMGSTSDWVCRSLLLGAAYARGKWRAVRV